MNSLRPVGRREVADAKPAALGYTDIEEIHIHETRTTSAIKNESEISFGVRYKRVEARAEKNFFSSPRRQHFVGRLPRSKVLSRRIHVLSLLKSMRYDFAFSKLLSSFSVMLSYSVFVWASGKSSIHRGFFFTVLLVFEHLCSIEQKSSA